VQIIGFVVCGACAFALGTQSKISDVIPIGAIRLALAIGTRPPLWLAPPLVPACCLLHPVVV
jgi:hypothetical protein